MAMHMNPHAAMYRDTEVLVLKEWLGCCAQDNTHFRFTAYPSIADWRAGSQLKTYRMFRYAFISDENMSTEPMHQSQATMYMFEKLDELKKTHNTVDKEMRIMTESRRTLLTRPLTVAQMRTVMWRNVCNKQ
jgi:hypothetical protein